MLYLRAASADDENRPDDGIKDLSNYKTVTSGKTYKELLKNIIEAANNDDFTLESWLIVTGQAEEPNARLIAAAPELLKALQIVEPIIDDVTESVEPGRMIRAAISKARGEE